MNITKLVAENIKRIKAVEITPDGTLTVIGGKNGAGKSSVLDSIAYALGGERLVPSEPIRAGESEGKVVVDLGDLIVTRKFKREKIDTSTSEEKTRSTLVVTNKDGAKYPSPQALLDKMLGQLTFDPLAFSRADPKDQDKILRRVVNLDVSAFEKRRADAAMQRAMLKKQVATKQAQLQAMPKHEGVPAEEISFAEIREEMKRADEYRVLAEEAELAVSNARRVLDDRHRDASECKRDCERLEKQLEEERRRLTNINVLLDKDERDLDAKQITAQAARAVVPDIKAISDRMTELDLLNKKIRDNARYQVAAQVINQDNEQIELLDNEIIAADGGKRLALEAAVFPVPGLGLADGGVTFGGRPLEQASTSEQVRISVAIGIALNPTLKVLLIRNGNLLDRDSIAAVTKQAEAAGVQVWMEYITESADGVAVMLVDGEQQ